MKENLDDIFSYASNDIPEELLIRYVEDRVSADERRKIERRLADDPFLSDAVDGLMSRRDPVKHRIILRDIHKKINAHSSARMVKILPLWSIIQIAAAVSLIFIAAWFVNYLIKKPDDKIFTEEFTPYPPAYTVDESSPISTQNKDSITAKISSGNLPVNRTMAAPKEQIKQTEMKPGNLSPADSNTMSASEGDIDRINKKQISRGLEFYKAARYSLAIAQFDSVIMRDALDETAGFYNGISYLALGDADRALKNLFNIGSQSTYYESALWYESLAYLHKNQKQECMGLLNKIIALNGNYKSPAEDLLKKLH